MFLMSPFLCLGVEFDNLVRRDGFYYEKSSNAPFTGKVTGKEQGSMKKGMKESYWLRYHDNGQLFSKGAYKNGDMVGQWAFFKRDGTIIKKYSGTYANGKKIRN